MRKGELTEVFEPMDINIDDEPEIITDKCEHGKRKVYCEECGGSHICIHGKNKK